MDTADYKTWFAQFKKSSEFAEFEKKPIAYFCAEYALAPHFPTYAGGLGVLAGDYIREIKAQGLPIFAVGLLYRYAQNSLVPASAEHEGHTADIKCLTLVSKKHSTGGDLMISGDDKDRLLISVPIHDQIIYAQAWLWDDGEARVYLLDTNISENSPHDRGITERLYVDDREMRLKQEMVLGIGGFRLLAALGHHCSVYHLNEGHSAFLALELVRHEMRHQHVDFSTACDYAAKHILFTNHTLVAAGQEQFALDLVSAMLSKYAEEIELPVADIVALGTIQGSDLFSMTTLSFRLSTYCNGVSKLHAARALDIWPKHPMKAVTNGVYLPRWDCVGARASSPETFWPAHQENKKKLLAVIKEKTSRAWDENTLLIAWARRMVPYKRPLLFLEQAERLLAIATKANQPVRIVFAGPTNNQNEDANEIVAGLKKRITETFSDIAVFLPNYNTELAGLLTAGSDVWLNTPVVGSEACGTSGMKAALNGSLPFSTRDGWMDEVNISGSGWVVDENDVTTTMMNILEHEIVPQYYNQRGEWLAHMSKARELIVHDFSVSRMLKQYIEEYYLPILREKHDHKYQ
jgi:glycogen phosphorylase